MTPLAALAPALRCPVCAAGFPAPEAGWRCASGHGFDLAKQGYLNLLVGKGAGSPDDAAMVEAVAVEDVAVPTELVGFEQRPTV